MRAINSDIKKISTLIHDFQTSMAVSSPLSQTKFAHLLENYTEYYKNIEPQKLETLLERFSIELFFVLLLLSIIKKLVLKNTYLPELSQLFEQLNTRGIDCDTKYRQRIEQILDYVQENSLNIKNIEDLLEEALDYDDLLSNDQLGTLIQQILPSSLRKSFAAHFTSIITSSFLALLALDDRIIHITDPFSGSGRLLTAYLNEYSHQNHNKSITIELNDLFSLAAQLTLIQIIYKVIKLGMHAKIIAHMGDAFSKLRPPLILNMDNEINYFGESDLVIMNPPFTRYLRLNQNYMNKLYTNSRLYKKYLSQQMGIHIFALFLADRILKPSGRIAAVLPASTFYSKYSKRFRMFFLVNYNIHYIIGTSIDKSFSEESDLKEVLIIADKIQKPEENNEYIEFITLNSELTYENYIDIAQHILENKENEQIIKKQRISKKELNENWNWIRFLEQGPLHAIANKLKEKNIIRSGSNLHLRIVRGFEMYGPDFFFIPNKDWKISSENETSIQIKHSTKNIECTFPKEILNEALRKPGLYIDRVTPEIHHYTISIAETQKEKVPTVYVDERKPYWQIAKHRFGEHWISHIYHQLGSKRPFGQLFVVDKFGMTSTGTIIHYFDHQITASKNFYLIDCPSDRAKILAAWMSSSIFILLFLSSRREIGGAFGRLQIIDYQEEPIFLNIDDIPKDQQYRIIKAFDKYRKENLPALKDQLYWKPRRDLDQAIIEALPISTTEQKELLELIYQEIARMFNELDTRGKKHRGRD